MAILIGRPHTSFTQTQYNQNIPYNAHIQYGGVTVYTTELTGRSQVTSSLLGRPQVMIAPDTYLLTEDGLVINTESGLQIIFEYGIPGTSLNGRIIPP